MPILNDRLVEHPLGMARPAQREYRETSVSTLGHNPVRMSNAGICTTRTGAGNHWLHTLKFNPHHHFQRWRSAT
jgi:hypothetical protein